MNLAELYKKLMVFTGVLTPVWQNVIEIRYKGKPHFLIMVETAFGFQELGNRLGEDNCKLRVWCVHLLPDYFRHQAYFTGDGR